MERTGIRGEEKTGLIVAVGLHLLVLAALLIQAAQEVEPIPQTERMTVNLATDVGLEATAPDPVPESRAAIAPTLAAPTLADTPAPVAEPQPELPRPIERPVTRPVERPAPRIAEAPSRPQPRPEPRREQPRREAAKPQPAKQTGGSRIGNDFLAGAGASTTTSETRTPASQIGASAKASLFQAVGRQLRPHWQPPSGPDVDKIVTKVRFRLNPNGSLSGKPSVVSQSGVNDTNKAQAGRHGEQAIRAVQLAAPFDLPEEYYDAWKLVTVDFDWKLSQ